MPKTIALDREDRLRQIKQCFSTELQSGRDGHLTIADIARMMHLKPSTKLRLMVEELVMNSEIISTVEPMAGVAGFRRIYRPNEGEFQRYKPQYKGGGRSIKVNGKQMAMNFETGG